jgi:hypothetical protein
MTHSHTYIHTTTTTSSFTPHSALTRRGEGHDHNAQPHPNPEEQVGVWQRRALLRGDAAHAVHVDVQCVAGDEALEHLRVEEGEGVLAELDLRVFFQGHQRGERGRGEV